VFRGLNGVVIKSHGGTDPQGFASAIDLAVDMARSDLVPRIARDIGAFHAAGRQTNGFERQKAIAS